jgi:diguanylate cyclase (GGDEF)-like protein/PAS domain S-box-containing protein
MGEKRKSREELSVLSLFQTLADIIGASKDLEEALQAALKEICEITNLSFAQIWHPSVDERYLECGAAWYSLVRQHENFRKASEILRLNPGEDLPGKVFLAKKPFWFASLSDAKKFPRHFAAISDGLKSGFAIPILVNGKVLAVVEFFLAESQQEDKDLVAFVAGFATQLGLLLQRNQAEAALRRQEKEYRILFENNPTPMLICEEVTQKILTANEAAITHFGYSLEEFQEMNFRDFVVESGNSNFSFDAHSAELVRVRKKNNTERLVEITGKEINFQAKKAKVFLLSDVTERYKAEEMIRHQAYHDALTGLPNRLLFQDRLEISLARCHRHQHMLALLFLDLDRFKNINDTLGHAVGDRLLQHVAAKLKKSLREEDTVARFGGDEFMILLPKIKNAREAVRVAQKILKLFQDPWPIDENELYITASIGIALYPVDGENAQTLIRNADTAMYRAKGAGRNTYQLYTSTMNVKAFEHLMLENRLRYALEHEEFVVYYQPQIDLKTGKVIGMEALVRWQHPGLGLLSPKRFIFLAEETGLVAPLGEWVLKTACWQNKEWQKAGLPKLTVSVNLAPRQFQQKNLVKIMKRILNETKLDPTDLGVEVTESIAMENVDFTIEILREFRKMGIEISIDDFGTGYSSLSYLKKFPIQRLKIDKTFIQDICENPNDAAIAASVIILARNLKIKAMAEGVETQEQLDFLKEKDCDEVQGYFFSKPLPPNEFVKFVQNLNGNHHEETSSSQIP